MSAAQIVGFECLVVIGLAFLASAVQTISLTREIRRDRRRR